MNGISGELLEQAENSGAALVGLGAYLQGNHVVLGLVLGPDGLGEIIHYRIDALLHLTLRVGHGEGNGGDSQA